MGLDGRQVDDIIAGADLPAIIGSYTPIQKRGSEYVARCVFHSPDNNPSLSIYHAGNGSGKWRYKCFSCGEEGDAVDFLRNHDGLDFKAAIERISGGTWKPLVEPSRAQRKPPAERITSKPPSDAAAPDMTIRDLGKPAKVWTYLDSDGATLGYVARYETDHGKEIRCWTWGKRGKQPEGWGCGHWTKPRPLYGLNELAKRPDASALVVEGEKAADAARELLPSYVVVAWPGGANAWHKADWSLLAGRKVLLWPDADDPGIDCMAKIAAHLSDPAGLACELRVVDVLKGSDNPTDEIPPGWDLANAQVEGWNTQMVIDWAKPRARNYSPTPAPPQEAVPPPITAAPDPSPVGTADGAGPPDEPIPIEAYATDSAVSTQKRKRRPRLAAVDGNAVPAPEQDAEALPTPMSEDAIADAFADEHQQDWRYVAQWGHWLHWEEFGWRRDQKELIDRLAVEMCRRACTWGEAQALTPDQRRRLGQRKTAGAVRDLARHDRRIAAAADGWDADPLLVGVPGGVFDVRTGKMITGEREQYITRCTTFAPSQGAPKLWLEHLRRMMDGDDSMVDFLHNFAGYCITGDVSEQCFLFLYGMGQTGKGTFLLTLYELMGSYAAQSSASTFMSADREKHSSEIARLAGCRLVVIDETDSTHRWNEERIKRMTGGGRITAARKYHDEEDILVTWKLAFAGNHKPALRGVGKEMERRIRLVKCNASIPDEAVDKKFRERMIAAEGPQILNWILEGAMLWHQSGLPLPEGISDATRDYLQSEDVLGDWLDENCETRGDVKRSDAFRNYADWAEKRGDRPWSNRAWWAAMEDRGYRAKKSNGIWYVAGLSLKTAAPTTPYQD